MVRRFVPETVWSRFEPQQLPELPAPIRICLQSPQEALGQGDSLRNLRPNINLIQRSFALCPQKKWATWRKSFAELQQKVRRLEGR